MIPAPKHHNEDVRDHVQHVLLRRPSGDEHPDLGEHLRVEKTEP